MVEPESEAGPERARRTDSRLHFFSIGLPTFKEALTNLKRPAKREQTSPQE